MSIQVKNATQDLYYLARKAVGDDTVNLLEGSIDRTRHSVNGSTENIAINAVWDILAAVGDEPLGGIILDAIDDVCLLVMYAGYWGTNGHYT